MKYKINMQQRIFTKTKVNFEKTIKTNKPF